MASMFLSRLNSPVVCCAAHIHATNTAWDSERKGADFALCKTISASAFMPRNHGMSGAEDALGCTLLVWSE